MWRDPSTYGLQEIGPQQMFAKEEAELALHFADEVSFSLAKNILCLFAYQIWAGADLRM